MYQVTQQATSEFQPVDTIWESTMMGSRLDGINHKGEIMDEQTGTYDVDDIAQLLKSSTRTVRRIADKGEMPRPIKIGRLIRWPKTMIDNWISSGCPKNAV